MVQNLIQLTVNGILLGGIYSVISLGLTLIFGVTRIINFAHGEFLMLAMYASFWLFKFAGIDPYLSLIIVVPVLFFAGLASERLVIHPILDAPPFMQIFATVGLSVAMQNAALLFWTADYRSIQVAYSTKTILVGETTPALRHSIVSGPLGYELSTLKATSAELEVAAPPAPSSSFRT